MEHAQLRSSRLRWLLLWSLIGFTEAVALLVQGASRLVNLLRPFLVPKIDLDPGRSRDPAIQTETERETEVGGVPVAIAARAPIRPTALRRE
jgi:hypothetical protein